MRFTYFIKNKFLFGTCFWYICCKNGKLIIDVMGKTHLTIVGTWFPAPNFNCVTYFGIRARPPRAATRPPPTLPRRSPRLPTRALKAKILHQSQGWISKAKLNIFMSGSFFAWFLFCVVPFLRDSFIAWFSLCDSFFAWFLFILRREEQRPEAPQCDDPVQQQDERPVRVRNKPDWLGVEVYDDAQPLPGEDNIIPPWWPGYPRE